MISHNTILSRSLFLITLFGLSGQALAAANEGSFTPTQVNIPILEVFLADSTTGIQVPVYECTATDCTVNVADDTALQAVFSNTEEIRIGNYDQVGITNCKTTTGYDTTFQGEVTLGGTTYYTTSGTDPLSTDIADLGLVTVPTSGCQFEFNLPSAVTIAENESVHFSLFINLVNIAWARLNSNIIPGGCFENSSQNQSVCIAYPDVVPHFGTATPTAEVYHIANDNNTVDTAGGQIILVFDSSDNLLGGFSRRLFSETSTNTAVQFDTPLMTYSDNGDTTFTLENFGNATNGGSFRIIDFLRMDHSASYTDSSGGSQNYSAYRQ